MEQKLDGVKVAVGKKIKKEVSKRPLENIAVKKTRVKKLSKEIINNKIMSEAKPSNGILKIIIAIVVTALIVGGGIYAWQNSSVQKKLSQVSEESRTSRMEYESRLTNLKDQVSTFENENKQLKTDKESLLNKMKLLATAKKEYSNSDLGINFVYPASLGDLTVNTEKGATGNKLNGIFSETDKVIMNGVSKDYSLASSTASSSINFLNSTGYYKKGDKYYFQIPGKKDATDYEIKPVKIIKAQDSEILVVNKTSFGGKIDIGENIGALINVKNENFSGLAFMDYDFGVLPLADFEKMLEKMVIAKK
jgi:hypothetical protein